MNCKSLKKKKQNVVENGFLSIYEIVSEFELEHAKRIIF